MIPRYAEHPLSQILPMMDESDLKELADDIGENGLRENIVLYEDKILDGRNRYRACEMVKVAPRFTHLNGGRDPLAFIISTNIRRRHLTESQRALVAAKIATMRRGGDRTEKAQSGAKTVKQAASELNVSPRSVTSAKKVLSEAEPEDVKAVEDGKKTVSEVEKKLKTKKDKPKEQLDKTGYPIPESILFDWNRAVETSRALLSSISDVRSELRNALKEQDIIFAEVTNTTVADLDNAYTSLKCVTPYAVCTSCQGHNRKKCGLCKGRGFISEFAWRSFVPAEIKKMRGAK